MNQFTVTTMSISLYDDRVHNSRLALSAFVHHLDLLNMFCVRENLSFCMRLICSLDTLFNKNVIGVHKKCKNKSLSCLIVVSKPLNKRARRPTGNARAYVRQCAVAVHNAGDVDVRPVSTCSELTQEGGSDACAAADRSV